MSSLKERKEQFVSDLIGGSTWDVYKITSISAISYFIWCIVKNRTTLFDDENKSSVLSIALDFLFNWNNLLLSTTIYANNIALLIVLNALPISIILLTQPNKALRQRSILINLNKLTVKEFLPFKSYITVYRAQMMIITCICIMAVDFHIFPRRFAKVETWGTSLMDLGVGSFVFSMGLITARSFLRQHFVGKHSYVGNLFKAIKGSLPIFILGLIRLISVKSVDYQEHVTEYGKQWNFFFTLACMPLLANLLSPVILRISPIIFSFIVVVGYEFALVKGGLLEYIIIANRNGFISNNKEGLCSLFGYFAIFLNGLSLGSCILPVVPTPHNLFKLTNNKAEIIKNNRWSLTPLQSLFSTTVFFQVVYYIVDTCFIYGVSRRMANFLYVIWVSAYNCTFLLLYKLIEDYVWGSLNVKIVSDSEDIKVETDIAAISSNETIPDSLTAVNINSLVLFIVSNLLTGLINLTYNTLDSTPWLSLLILVSYELILSGFTMILYKSGIVIR